MERIFRFFTITVTIAIMLISIPKPSFAQGLDDIIVSSITLELSQNFDILNNQSLLNPDNRIIYLGNLPMEFILDGMLELYPVSCLYFRFTYELKVENVYGVLYNAFSNNNSNTGNIDINIDSYYLTLDLGGFFALHFGKMIYSNSIGYFVSPANYLNKYNTNLSESIFHNDRGFTLIGFEFYFDVFKILLYYIPSIKQGKETEVERFFNFVGNPNNNMLILDVRIFLFSNTNIWLCYFLEEKERNKFNDFFMCWSSTISILISEIWSIHLEGSVSNGQTIYIVENIDQEHYEFIVRNKDTFYLKLIVGTEFSILEHFTIYIDYYYNGFGYSKDEYEIFIASLENANQNLGESDIHYPNEYFLYLLDALSNYNHLNLRQHYLLIRFAWMNNKITIDNNFILSLEDGSLFNNFGLKFNYNGNLAFNVSFFYAVGTKNSIYKLFLYAVSFKIGIEYTI